MQRLSEDRNMMELYETLENLHKVREKYFESFDKLKHEENVFITNGNRSFEEIFNDIWNKIDTMQKPHKSYS
jgi:dTMP kinase